MKIAENGGFRRMQTCFDNIYINTSLNPELNHTAQIAHNKQLTLQTLRARCAVQICSSSRQKKTRSEFKKTTTQKQSTGKHILLRKKFKRLSRLPKHRRSCWQRPFSENRTTVFGGQIFLDMKGNNCREPDKTNPLHVCPRNVNVLCNVIPKACGDTEKKVFVWVNWAGQQNGSQKMTTF